MSILYLNCLKLLCVLQIVHLITADKIVKSPQTVRSVNYEDFSLLCADGIPLLMEDHKPRPCQPRPWLKEQKCPTGFWCHEGQSEHSFYCCPSSRKFANRCHLPPAVGYGKQRMRRFYFDWKTDACHELQYSGIGGNENIFMDYEQCERVCRGAGEPPILLPSNMKVLPKETTKDFKKMEKPEMEKKMVYPKEVAAPVSLQPPSLRTTKPADVHESFYTVSPQTSSVPHPTTLSTTHSKQKPTTTEAEIPEVFDPNPCSLSPDKGFPGSVTVNMWYYDPTSTTCSPFMYLGKGGNSNRFETSEECLETCGIGKPTRKSCELPPAIGNGPFNIPRYYFDRVTKKCERFFYSGRDGNDNRFYKKNKCERLCLRKKPKKKENIYEFTTTPSTPSVIYESTPLRIIQNLVPSETRISQSTSTFAPTADIRVHTDPYDYVTPTPTQSRITVEPWIERFTEKSSIYEYSTTPHPTLIYEPHGETLPTLNPPTTTTPSIVDHVFSSLMNTQQQKLVEFVHVPTDQKTTGETPRKFSSHETIPFGQVEQQPIPMNPFGSAKPTVNKFGMKYVTSPPDNNDSPCSRSIYGDATIMCENRQEICPMGTFCQIGQGQSICCPIMDEPPCEQAIEEGVGNVLLRRWYFDPATRLCQPFYYKGFKGNQNNFQSFDSCSRACGATNVCSGGSPQMSVHTHLLSCNFESDCPYSHDCIQSTPHNLCCPKTSHLVPESIPAPPFEPVQMPIPAPPAQVSQPQEQSSNMVIDFVPATHASNNLCGQPIDVGFGVLSEHRWAYSAGQCTSFLYSGHGGNMNNFLTRNDCMKTCQSPMPPPSSQCSQPAASGQGDQYLSRYFFSPEYRQCLHFIYSGEGGNQNNFDSLTDCLETCVANGIKFSSLANSPMSAVPPPPPTLMPSPPVTSSPFTFVPRNMCPQGDPLITVDGTPIQCDPSKAAKCPGDHVCTPRGNEAYCCPSPMNFCLQSRPPISVCSGPDFEPVREIRFTYDPLADRCVRFSFQNCRGAAFSPTGSLNNFVSNSQCNRLCCNQGYNLVYKRRLLMAMNDDPIVEDD
ncbi:BPTI/Kunitz inhibitor domain-containing protein [Caenorhabditis elegans]|uniref:BPTI/Kunitz inhibitor domain-containing protein n=1 Tax=Caenorhabditis elegans TaxID=6239 RepID=G3MU06_CAEEL|nr:BPTI/Kunitz inhibitor domain-containing protein [Caenorhabditis elegans]CCD31171.1 BPTI/Kunitz inhibitor domain-containing protein [Caenorhabditis elegans]|eukprot:NP_001256131.1 Uncharacterized protein CELE_ZK287.4 [Caenorhabditis elegans]